MTSAPSQAQQQLVRDYVDDGTQVSTTQRDAVLHPGRFFLNACPGSGKTRTVGVRVAYWSGTVDDQLGRPRRMAAVSYTNTAVREIRKAATDAGVVLEDPSFAGTLHRFLMRYVLRPFGAAVMESERPPRVVMVPGRERLGRTQIPFKYGFTKGTVPAWLFEWRTDGTLSLPDTDLPFALRGKVDAATLSKDLQASVLAAKGALAREGLLSMTDLLYWSMRALEDETVAEVVASRFDELIVDEVQDTSDVQQQCLRHLLRGGLRSVVYVGDMEQAIYGFAHADVDALKALIAGSVENELRLTENWRSSQAICDVAYQFSGRQEADRAVGEFAGEGRPPELIRYPDGHEADAVEAFRRRLDELGICASDSVVLCRWSSTAERLAGAVDAALTGGLRTVVSATAEARGAGPMRRESIDRLEQLLLSFVEPEIDPDGLDNDARRRLRDLAVRVIETVPAFDVDAKSFAAATRDVVAEAALELGAQDPAVGSKIRAPAGAGHLAIDEICGGQEDQDVARTIHSVKGESHLATLLVAVGSDRGDANWTTWLGAADSEEVRVAYVALTRAQRYSALALPHSCPDEVVNAFVARGFVLHND